MTDIVFVLMINEASVISFGRCHGNVNAMMKSNLEQLFVKHLHQPEHLHDSEAYKIHILSEINPLLRKIYIFFYDCVPWLLFETVLCNIFKNIFLITCFLNKADLTWVIFTRYDHVCCFQGNSFSRPDWKNDGSTKFPSNKTFSYLSFASGQSILKRWCDQRLQN